MSRHPRPAPMGLARAGLFVAALTMLGNLLGFVREMVLTAVYGANANTDAYVAAWTVPETFAPLLMEGLLPIVLTPWLVKHAASRRELSAAASAALVPVAVGSSVLAGLIVVLAPALVAVLTPDLAEPELAVQCVVLAAGTVPAIAVAGVLGAVLRSGHALVSPALVYTAYNLGIIATILLFGPRYGVAAAAAGLTVGAVVMCLSQLPAYLRVAGFRQPLRVRRGALRVALTVAVPTVAYLVLRQSQVFVERNIGSRLGEGAVTYLNLAQKLGQLPVTLTLALALVAFPALARLSHGGQLQEAGRLVTAILRTVIAVLVTAAVGAVALAEPLVRLAFGRGAFDADAVTQTANTLAVYCLGLPAQGVVTTCALAYFAIRRRSWTPALHLAGCLLVTIAAAVPLAAAFGTQGMAGANAIGITVAAVGLVAALARRRLVDVAALAAPIGRALAVNLVAGGVFLLVAPLAGPALPEPGAGFGILHPLGQLAGYLVLLVAVGALADLVTRGRVRRDLVSFRTGR